MSAYSKLLEVQTKLHAPKSQYNSFGKYYYRNCEDILEAFKPIGAEMKALITVNDTLELIGDRYYIKATAIFVDTETGEKIENTAYAREEESKKGMDASQVTGATSSYARKYALNGLLCIDDTKDADSQDNSQNDANKGTKQANSQNNDVQPNYCCEKCGLPFTDFDWKGKHYTAKQGYEIAKKNCNGTALCNKCKKEAGL